MKQLPFEYQGSELDLFLEAKTWRTYWASMISPFLGQTVLEVGAGLGSSTKVLRDVSHTWVALEPDPTLIARAQEGVSDPG